MSHKIIRTLGCFAALSSGVVAFCMAAHASEYERLQKQYDDTPSPSGQLPVRAAPPPATQATWIYGTPDSIDGVAQYSVDGTGVKFDKHDICQDYSPNAEQHPKKLCNFVFREDPYGLFILSSFYWNENTRFTDTNSQEMVSFAMTGTLSDPHAIDISTTESYLTSTFRLFQWGLSDHAREDYMTRTDMTCAYKSASADVVHKECKGKVHQVANPDEPGDDSDQDYSENTDYYWNDALKIFTRRADVPLDTRAGNGPWHSQEISAALTPAQKEDARKLFAAAFDAYKTGDSAGAVALFVEGLKIDPANAMAWSTLADINLAKVKLNPDDMPTLYQAMRDSQRVLDLEPVGVEATLARAHLNQYQLDYNDMGTALPKPQAQ